MLGSRLGDDPSFVGGYARLTWPLPLLKEPTVRQKAPVGFMLDSIQSQGLNPTYQREGVLSSQSSVTMAEEHAHSWGPVHAGHWDPHTLRSLTASQQFHFLGKFSLKDPDSSPWEAAPPLPVSHSQLMLFIPSS